MNDANSPDAVIGEDFLTWLWYRSEVNPEFRDRNGEPFAVYLEQRISVSGGEGQARETASVTGAYSELNEARLGVASGKKVNRAFIRVEKDEHNFQFTLKAATLSPLGLKTPKPGDNEDADSDAVILEKIYLVEVCLSLIDSLFADFIKIRLSPAWNDEQAAVGQWLAKANRPARK